MGFIYSAIDQIVNHAARMRNRTRGRLSCPLVLRAPFGGGIGAPEHHSESTEAMFTSIPGLRTVIPSSPVRAYGLLRAAIADPDPVVFLEPKRIYRSVREPVDLDAPPLSLDTCFKIREGGDITLVSWGALVGLCLNVADRLADEGINAAVIDVATLSPFDPAVILDSVAETGRSIVVHEAPRTNGFGAEVAAALAELGLFSLVAPVQRVTGYDTIMPLSRLEQHYLPNEDRVVKAARDAMAYT
jgi:pyruvate dehydrogenase E1 component beta subunit